MHMSRPDTRRECHPEGAVDSKCFIHFCVFQLTSWSQRETMKIRLKRSGQIGLWKEYRFSPFLHLVFIRLILVHATFTTCIVWLSVPAVFWDWYKKTFFREWMCVAWNLCIAVDLGSRQKFMGGIFILYVICSHVIYDSKLHSALQYFFKI